MRQQPLGLDVHLLICSDSNASWVVQCLESLEAALDRAPFPVQLHILDGEIGHLGRSRMRGYRQGSHPYVTYVDDDDFVLPHCFEVIYSELVKRPDALFCREYTLQNGYQLLGRQRHHLAILKRELVFDQSDWVVCGDIVQLTSLGDLDCVDIPEPVYVHRLYGDSKCRVMRRQHPEEYRIAQGPNALQINT